MFRSKTILLCTSALFLFRTVAVSQTPGQPASAPSSALAASASLVAKLQGLDDLAAGAIRQWKVPGVAIAVVQDGKVIYAKGYGGG